MKKNSTEPKTAAQKLDFCFRIFLGVMALLASVFCCWVALLLMFVAEGFGQRNMGIAVGLVALAFPCLAIRLLRQKPVKPDR